MRNRTILSAVVLLLAAAVFSFSSRATASAPTRVVVDIAYSRPGFSKVTLSWEGNAAIQRLASVSPSGEVHWTQLASNVTSFTEEARDFMNVNYRVGTPGNWLEVRAFPPGINAHANYTATGDTCVACHSIHMAQGPKLLAEEVSTNLCRVCHNGSGSKYDVFAGQVQVGGGRYIPSPAGPFGLDEPNSPVKPTSFHNIYASSPITAPGGSKRSLTCTDCHSAHDTGSSSPFRMLKIGIDDYNPDPIIAYSVTTFDASNRVTDYRTLYVSGMNEFCSACHYRYNNRGGSAREPFMGLYRHPVDIDATHYNPPTLPLESGRMTCKTCHYAHGTTVIGAAPSELGGVSTALKRNHNSGVCVECHTMQ